MAGEHSHQVQRSWGRRQIYSEYSALAGVEDRKPKFPLDMLFLPVMESSGGVQREKTGLHLKGLLWLLRPELW